MVEGQARWVDGHESYLLVSSGQLGWAQESSLKDTVPGGVRKYISEAQVLLFTHAHSPFSHDSLLQDLLSIILYKVVSISLE